MRCSISLRGNALPENRSRTAPCPWDAQGAEDEEFWKGLSEEEKKKTRELLDKIKESKDGNSPKPVAGEGKENIANDKEDVPLQENQIEASTKESPPAAATQPIDMFSDYGDGS